MGMHNQSKQSFPVCELQYHGLQVACETLHSVLNEEFYVGTVSKLFQNFVQIDQGLLV